METKNGKVNIMGLDMRAYMVKDDAEFPRMPLDSAFDEWRKDWVLANWLMARFKIDEAGCGFCVVMERADLDALFFAIEGGLYPDIEEQLYQMGRLSAENKHKEANKIYHALLGKASHVLHTLIFLSKAREAARDGFKFVINGDW